ncbi:MAG: 3-deoxy-7-phosphoheptulonate synthase [Clostridiaceae bacterium]|nr:3-deoxy-7-phosphoheptulonate synthase [Clostridiaceae bacterium]
MIIIMKTDASKIDIEKLKSKLEGLGFRVNESGENRCVLGLIGDTASINIGQIEANIAVDRVMRVTDPFKRANRLFHADNTIVDVSGNLIGGKKIVLMAGPCSVESEEQILTIAEAVKKSGATFLRGGAFKPRTSPYSFQGLKGEGIRLLKLAREKTGLPIVSEIMSTELVEKVAEDVDILQIGARNMQNYELLKEVGKTRRPVLLKRGLSATIEEFLMSAEYIMSEGNENVILCERGIRTFEPYTRNTLDISVIPAIKRLSHLPIIIDPSHAAGKWWMVEALSKAAVAAGADGLIIEVHNDPENAWSDGEESLKPEKFDALTKKLRQIAIIEDREI